MDKHYKLMFCSQDTAMRPLSPEKQPFLHAHLEEKKNAVLREQSFGAYEALFRLCDECAVKEVPRIVYADSGKPYFEGGYPFFSLSHTEGVSLACLSLSCDVGVDIESLRAAQEKEKAAAYRALADRMFYAEEREALSEASDDVFLRAFLSIYTQKEALAKLLSVPVMQVNAKKIPRGVRLMTEIAKDGDYVYSVALLNDHD